MRDAVSVTVPRPIYNRLKARLKPYQALAGGLQELLDLADKVDAANKDPLAVIKQSVLNNTKKE